MIAYHPVNFVGKSSKQEIQKSTSSQNRDLGFQAIVLPNRRSSLMGVYIFKKSKFLLRGEIGYIFTNK